MVDETELIEAAQAGDRVAFDELVRRTYVDVFTLAVRLTGNEEDARDVVQDAYFRAWKGIGRFRGDAELSTWLYRITANCASTHLFSSAPAAHRAAARRARAGRRCATRPSPRRWPRRPSTSSASPGRSIDCPPKLRAVVVLRDVYGLPHEAIAEELGISVSAAKVRLHRARNGCATRCSRKDGQLMRYEDVADILPGPRRRHGHDRRPDPGVHRVRPALPGRAGPLPPAAPEPRRAADHLPGARARRCSPRRSTRLAAEGERRVARSILTGPTARAGRCRARWGRRRRRRDRGGHGRPLPSPPARRLSRPR